MAWNVQLDAGLGVIVTVFSGTITREDARASAVEALKLATGRGPHLFLTDVRDADSELSVFDIFETPKRWERLGANRRNQLALVVAARGAMRDDAQFYELVGRNEGWNVRVFSERKEAIDWLTQKRAPNKKAAQNGPRPRVTHAGRQGTRTRGRRRG